MYRFVDKNEFIPGFPTRDLTAEEWNELPFSDSYKAEVLASGLYVYEEL